MRFCLIAGLGLCLCAVGTSTANAQRFFKRGKTHYRVVPSSSTYVQQSSIVTTPRIVQPAVVQSHVVMTPTAAPTTVSSSAVVPAASVVTPASATVTSNVGQVTSAQVQARPVANSFQAEAEQEARQMASRRYKGHVRGTIPGVRFCGVGWSSSSPNAPTCRPSGNMTLVADAVVRGSDGWYRVRYWR